MAFVISDRLLVAGDGIWVMLGRILDRMLMMCDRNPGYDFRVFDNMLYRTFMIVDCFLMFWDWILARMIVMLGML